MADDEFTAAVAVVQQMMTGTCQMRAKTATDPCGRPAIYRVEARCPACGRTGHVPMCVDHGAMARQGDAYCQRCCSRGTLQPVDLHRITATYTREPDHA
ncbi:MAG TPA: hypothetical protein VFX70_17455 [Mycobacteriales bacterium]|nr:hypothetical protein [Mycobacteriales bacterium]